MATIIVQGREFNVDQYLKSSDFKPDRIFYKGNLNVMKKVIMNSGFTIKVASDSFFDLNEQIVQVIALFTKHHEEFIRLSTFDKVETRIVSFTGLLPSDDSEIMNQHNVFPTDLLKILASCNFSIEYSLYPSGEGV